MATVVAPLERKPHHVARARWASIWLIIFMLIVAATPALPPINPSGAIAAHVNKFIFVVLLYYLTIQLIETATRSATDQAGYIEDNALAILAAFVGLGSFLLWIFVPWYRLTGDQGWILGQCTAVTLIDLFLGLLTSQRIAFAGKEREEEVSH